MYDLVMACRLFEKQAELVRKAARLMWTRTVASSVTCGRFLIVAPLFVLFVASHRCGLGDRDTNVLFDKVAAEESNISRFSERYVTVGFLMKRLRSIVDDFFHRMTENRVLRYS